MTRKHSGQNKADNQPGPKPSASGSSSSSLPNTSGYKNNSSPTPSSPLAPNKRAQSTNNNNMDEDFASSPISGLVPPVDTSLSPVAAPFVPSSSSPPPSTPIVEMVDDSIHATSFASKGKEKVTDDEDVPLDATTRRETAGLIKADIINVSRVEGAIDFIEWNTKKGDTKSTNRIDDIIKLTSKGEEYVKQIETKEKKDKLC
ncbi:hypothetical protein C1645_821471, partial [Glomus cerebriforme]